MAVPDSIAIITAAQDTDIHNRLAAIAARAGVADPHRAGGENIHRIVIADADATGDSSIATVLAYTNDVERLRLKYRTGENPAAVTDEHLLSALTNAGIITP